jgi:hypothetical protein
VWRAREGRRRWLLAEVQRLLDADAHGLIAEGRRLRRVTMAGGCTSELDRQQQVMSVRMQWRLARERVRTTTEQSLADLAVWSYTPEWAGVRGWRLWIAQGPWRLREILLATIT